MHHQTLERPKTARLLHIEGLRILAMFLVLFNHTGGYGYFLYAWNRDSALFPLYIFLSILDAIDIPLFFMISGALLLGKEESISQVYRRRIARFAVTLVVVSGIYYVYNWRFCGGPLNLGDFLATLYGSNVSVALWYLYGYIGLLVMLPLLRKLVRGMEEKDYFYLFACYFVLNGILPVAEYRLSRGAIHLSDSFSAPLVTSYSLFYFVMGYYFEKVMDRSKLTRRNLLLGALASFVTIGISAYMTMFKAGVTGELNEAVSQDFYGCMIAVPAFTVYAAFQALFARVQVGPRTAKCITAVGSATFGVYLLQGILLPRTEFVFHFFDPLIKTLPACFVWITTAFAIGTVITLLLKKIPGIKNFL